MPANKKEAKLIFFSKMEHSSSMSYTQMLMNSSSASQDPTNASSQQHPNIHTPHFAMNYPPPMHNSSIPHLDPQNTSSTNMYPSHFGMNYQPPHLHPYHPHNANLFLPHASRPQLIPTASGYQGGLYQGNVGQYSPGAYGGCGSNSPVSPASSMAFWGFAGRSGSRDRENSPMSGSATPLSAAHQVDDPANNEEESESSPDEDARKGKGKGKNWSIKEDEWLVSAWLHNSNDEIDGNSKKADRFWNQVAAEYNTYAPQELQKSHVQCKNHWNKSAPKVSKFNAVYNELKSTYTSGQSEEQLMAKVREKYKRDAKTKRPFPLEHWWKMVRQHGKWKRVNSLDEMNKRNKLDALGGYSSSNKDTEGEEEIGRPQGQKAAKRKAKGKAKCSTGNLTNENVEKFNDLQLRKSIAAEKMAAAALIQAETEKERVEAEKEKTKVDKLDKYLNLIAKDTSDYNDSQKMRHEQVVQYLARELGLN